MLPDFVTISRREFDAAIFDLDGVLTDTARVHAAAWKTGCRNQCSDGKEKQFRTKACTQLTPPLRRSPSAQSSGSWQTCPRRASRSWQKERFAKRVASALEHMVRREKVKAIIIVAPPRTLAELRNALHADVKSRIVAEIDKDLTKLPVGEIEKHLVG